MKRKNWLLLGILGLVALVVYGRKKENEVELPESEEGELEQEGLSNLRLGGRRRLPISIIVGDSQTTFIAMNTKLAKRLSEKQGQEALWQVGKDVRWLTKALEVNPVRPNVSNVIISIGTNSGFGKLIKDNIPLLFKNLRLKFPNAKFYVVQGSWGWGNLKGIKQKDVDAYYDLFVKEGAIKITPPIGLVRDPHFNLPVYKKIGENIDALISK